MADKLESEKPIAEDPRHEPGIELADAVIKYLELEGLKSSDIINKDNPWLDKLLSFAEDLKKSDGEVNQANLQDLIDIKEDKGKSLTLVYENSDLNITFSKEEEVYKGIFWQEALAAQEALATQQHSEGEKAVTAKAKGQIGEEAHKVATEASESPEQKAGEIHLKYQKEIEKLSKEEIKDFRGKISSSSIEDIRYNSKLLRDEKETDPLSSTKQETLRRLAAYTNLKSETDYSESWYTLNYSQFGVDKSGLTHEMNVGLGDIFIDPDIKSVLVQRQGEEAFIATRGTVSSGRHAGRVAFLDSNGKYVATFTGDRFRILSSEEATKEVYIQKLETEEKARTSHRETFKAEQAADLGREIEWQNNLKGKVQSPTTDTYIASKIDTAGENGGDVIAYCKETCGQFNIPWIIFKELVQRESSWNPGAKWDNSKHVIKSSAAGLGGWLSSSWEGFMQKGCGGKVLDDRWGSPKGSPITMEHRMNIYANAYATVWLINESVKAFPAYREKPDHERAFIYYLAHHEGVAGAIKYLEFINLMQTENHNTKGEIAAAYSENPDKYNQVLYPKQVKRIKKAGIQNFLSVYFNVAQGVALKVAGNDSELIAAKELTIGTESNESGEKLTYDPRTTAVIGASIMGGAAKRLPGAPDNFTKGGDGIRAVKEQFEQQVLGQPGKYKTLIMTGGTGNSFPNEALKSGTPISPKSVELAFRKITSNLDYIFRKAKESGMAVVIVTHPPWGKRLMEMAQNDPQKYAMLVSLQNRISEWTAKHPKVDRVIPLHTEFADSNDPNYIAKSVGEQKHGWHLTGQGYETMAARIMREFS